MEHTGLYCLYRHLPLLNMSVEEQEVIIGEMVDFFTANKARNIAIVGLNNNDLEANKELSL